MSLPLTTTPPQKHVFLPVSPTRSSSVFSFIATHGAEVTEDLLVKCAEVFSANYGIWGDLAGPLMGIILFFSGSGTFTNTSQGKGSECLLPD